MRSWLLVACAACSAPAAPRSDRAALAPAPPAVVAALVDAGVTAEAALGPVLAAALLPASIPPAATDAGVPTALAWRKGSTHVHAAPSGDSSTPPSDVIRWYETRGYDFIVLTDHNRVTELGASTVGEPWVRADGTGLLVLAGVELTHNPSRCEPAPPEPDGRCRIHVNGLAVTRRPAGGLEWAERDSRRRVDMYQRALEAVDALGGIAQLNHPQWHWGMSGPLLTELARRGLVLVEIANRQFDRWNAGEGAFPSTEALWDQALSTGVTLWGIASDDAHHYDGGGRYPAGGGWVMVWAARDPASIRDALHAGRFYASTGVELSRAGVEGGALVVEVAGERDARADGGGGERETDHTITFISGGQVVAEISGRRAQHPVPPAPGYVRAVVRRTDGARAWVQPARS